MSMIREQYTCMPTSVNMPGFPVSWADSRMVAVQVPGAGDVIMERLVHCDSTP